MKTMKQKKLKKWKDNIKIIIINVKIWIKEEIVDKGKQLNNLNNNLKILDFIESSYYLFLFIIL